DGSGLSRANRIAPATLAGVLRAASARAATAPLLADLPVGGFTGTLANRFGTDSAGRGLVRAKTGTLTGVHSLAGYVTNRDGTPLVFAVMTDDTEDVNPFVTQAAVDDVAAALAGCSCGG
ncbi:D-alanyl-D-alanine carboxypeptidase, partial [Aeromicrobium sp. CnD17-E]|uniref:D-alanyl-D-alanine carboxypeptidase n=1 Tax=Aeromicrobium sp. CnD17-E TaxID=2954487 RepID=UPI002097FB6E